MMVPVPTINKAYSILMERESQRNITNIESGEVITLMTTKK